MEKRGNFVLFLAANSGHHEKISLSCLKKEGGDHKVVTCLYMPKIFTL